jgi:hypothetical protein
MEPFRGWKAAPTKKMTHIIFKLTGRQKSRKIKLLPASQPINPYPVSANREIAY